MLRSQRGITLVELLAVIVLIGIIMAVVAKGIFGQAASAQARTNMIRMEKLKQSLELFRLEYGRYPGQIADLVKPSSEMRDTGKLFTPYASPDELQDVWKHDYIYQSEGDGRSFTLTTYGADGVTGGEGAKQDVTIRP